MILFYFNNQIEQQLIDLDNVIKDEWLNPQSSETGFRP